MKYKSAVAMICCESETYIQEWCCFQYLTGFDKIIIGIDHKNRDSTLLKLQGLPKHIVEKIDILLTIPGQFYFYHEVYRRYSRDIEWLACFDDDEYLYDINRRKINDLLDTVNKDTDQISLPWASFGHNRKITSATKKETRLETFTARDELHGTSDVKPVFRMTGIDTNLEQWYDCHTVKVTGCTRYFDGNTVSMANTFQAKQIPTWDQSLIHYVSGSMEDYIDKAKKWTGSNHRMDDRHAGWYESFLRLDYPIQDNRMSIYSDELKNLLSQCQ